MRYITRHMSLLQCLRCNCYSMAPSYYVDDFICAPTCPWSPSASAVALWLDASDLSTIVKVGNSVGKWKDKKNSGAIYGEAPLASREPQYGAASLGGKPGITFSKADDTLLEIKGGDISAAAVDWTIFAVYSSTDWLGVAGYYGGYIVGRPAAISTSLLLYDWAPDSGTERYGYWSPGGWVKCGEIASPTSPHMAVFRLKSTDQATIRDNGTPITACNASAFASVAVPVDSVIGNSNKVATNQLDGTIGELLMYTGNSTDSEVEKIEGYLAWKWGLEGSLPASHPYKSEKPLRPWGT
jgi:hypothetical protein